MINNNELIDQIKSYNRFLNQESLKKAMHCFKEQMHTVKKGHQQESLKQLKKGFQLSK